MAMGQQAPEVDAAEAKKLRKAAKRAAQEADVAAVVEESAEVDAAEAKRQRKAAKLLTAETAPAEEAPVEEDEAELKRQRKAAKKAAKAAAAAEAPEETLAATVEETPEIDEAEAKRQRKAAKKAAKAAAAAAEDAPEAAAEEAPEEGDEAEAKKQRKAAKKDAKAALEEEPEEKAKADGVETPKKQKKRAADSDEEEDAVETPAKKQKQEVESASGGKAKGKGNKEFEIFIGGLPFSTTEDVLKKDFAECGEILSFRMPLNDEGNARGIAFIEYKNKESCDKALKFSGTDYGGRTLTVRMSGDDKGKGKGKDGKDGKGKGKGNKEFEIFIGGLPFSTTEDVLKKDFAECGEIVNFRMPLNDEGNARGIAFVEYKDKESCDKALKFNETDYGGRTLSVRMSGDAGKGKGKDGKDGKGKGKGNKEFEVFVGGLPFATTEEAMKKDFAECGEIVRFSLPLNDEGNARGIAFIEYKDKESCDKALKFHETDYGGRTLTVKMSGDSSGKDGKGKDKGKGKGKKGKNKSGLSDEKRAANSGAMVESTGEKKTFDDSDDE